MPGIIVGSFGFQRSGKTLMAYLLADSFRKKGVEVYSNMDVPQWVKITALTDLPFNSDAKVLLLDEAYYFMDSRNWSDNTSSTIFFNTIGKQNICLILTAPFPDMIEKRLRDQMNYVYMVKGDQRRIHYKIIDAQRQKTKVFSIEKTQELFNSLEYDSNQVPDIVDCSLKDFKEKVDSYNNSKRNTNNKKIIGGYL